MIRPRINKYVQLTNKFVARNGVSNSSNSSKYNIAADNAGKKYRNNLPNTRWFGTAVINNTEQKDSFAKHQKELDRIQTAFTTSASLSTKMKTNSNANANTQLELAFSVLDIYKKSLYIQPRDLARNKLLNQSTTLLKNFLQTKRTPPEIMAQFLLAKDVRNITKLGLWHTPDIIDNKYYIRTVENLLNMYWDTNDVNNILLAQQLANILTNENPSNNRLDAESPEFDPMIYDRIIDFYFTTGNLIESRNLFEKIIQKDNGVNLNLDRVFQYQNGVNNLNNLLKDLKKSEQEKLEAIALENADSESKIMKSTVVNDESLIKETIYSFMVGVNICETKDETQQLFISTLELLKKIENHQVLASQDAIACFYVAKYAINLLGEDIDNIEIYNLYLYYLSSFYYHYNGLGVNGLQMETMDGDSDFVSEISSNTSNDAEALNIYEMVDGVDEEPNKKLMSDIFKNLERRVNKLLDKMERSSNNSDFIARRNTLLHAEKKKSRKSLLNRFLDAAKGNSDERKSIVNYKFSNANTNVKNHVLNEDIFTVLNQNASFFVPATFKELEARGLEPNKSTLRHMVNLLHTMYMREVGACMVTEYKIDANNDSTDDVDIVNDIILTENDSVATSDFVGTIANELAFNCDDIGKNSVDNASSNSNSSSNKNKNNNSIRVAKLYQENELSEKSYAIVNMSRSSQTDISELRKEFLDKYDGDIDEGMKEYIASLLLKIETRLSDDGGALKETKISTFKKLSPELQKLVHDFCSQIHGVSSTSTGFNIANAKKIVKYCDKRQTELLEFIWKEHAEKFIQSIWNVHMSCYSDMINKVFPQYPLLQENKDDSLNTAGSNDSNIEENENERGEASYATQASNIFTELKFMNIEDRHEHLSKMCKIRVAIIEKEALQADYNTSKLDYMAREKTPEGGKKVRNRLYYKNCRMLRKRNYYFGLVIDDLLSIRPMKEDRKTQKLDNIEGINSYMRRQIGRKVRWTDVDNFAIEAHYLFRTRSNLKYKGIHNYKERGVATNPIEISIMPESDLNFASALSDLSSWKHTLSIDQLYMKNLNILIEKLDALKLEEGYSSLAPAAIKYQDKDSMNEMIVNLKSAIGSQTDNEKMVKKKAQIVEKFSFSKLSESTLAPNYVDDFDVFLHVREQRDKKKIKKSSKQVKEDWQCKSCGSFNPFYRVFCRKNECSESRKASTLSTNKYDKKHFDHDRKKKKKGQQQI
jgi:hypothetical protein